MFSLVVRAEAFGNDIVQLPDFIPSRDRLVAIYAFQFRAPKRKISFSSVRALKTLWARFVTTSLLLEVDVYRLLSICAIRSDNHNT